MKPQTILTLFCVLLMGFWIGRFSSPSVISGDDPDDSAEGGPFRTRARERHSNPAPNTAFARLRKEIRSAPTSHCDTLLRKALETPDPFERRALFDELMARMDGSNFLEMSAAPARVSLETGRDNHAEWLLVHARAGQVAGPEAMARWTELGALGGPRAERTLWGWATQDPEAARKWLDEQADLPDSLRQRLFSTIMNGALINDPDRAIGLFGSLPEAVRVSKADEFVGAFVQHLGKDRAIEWLACVSASELESKYGQSLTRSVFDKAMWAGANQTNAMVMVADMERLQSIMPINEALINRGMGQIRDRKITGGIELLDQIARSPTLNRIPLGEAAWSNAVGHALQRDPAAVAKWLAENPDSPIHPVVSSMVNTGD
jgi:hypothetical protein